MRKKFTCLLMLLTLLCGAVSADQENLITISANGMRTTYAFDSFRSVTIADPYADVLTMNVKFNDGTNSVSNVRTLIREVVPDVPTLANDIVVNGINVYTRNKTIVVDCEKESTMIFFDTLGRQVGDCIHTQHCECTVTLTGIYIVLVDGKQYKIRID